MNRSTGPSPAFSPALRPLLFDFDGTLIDSREDLASAVNALLRELGLNPLPLDQVLGYVGRGARTLVSRSLEAADPDGRIPQDDSTRLRFLAHYSSVLLGHTRPYEGVINGLDTLLGASVPMALVTNKPMEPTRAILAGLGMERYFSVVMAGDSLPERKPHPLPLWAAADALGVARSRCLMVGDSDVDAEAASAAGMDFVWCPWGGIRWERPVGTTRVAADFAAVVAMGMAATSNQ